MIYTNILVPLDGSALAEAVMPHVTAIAEKGLVKNITFIRVVEEARIPTIGGDSVYNDEDWKKIELMHWNEAESYLKNLVENLHFEGVEVKYEVLSSGIVPEIILQYAMDNKTDLIIMATHGRSGISRLVWGSVAYHVLRSAYIPVLMIRTRVKNTLQETNKFNET